MNIGDMIRKYRTNMGMTQEELGNALVPKVQKSAVAKWENGRVENIKRSHIQQMVKLFGIDAREFIGLAESADILLHNQDEKLLIEQYRKLDEYDKGRIAAYLEMFLSGEKYKKESAG